MDTAFAQLGSFVAWTVVYCASHPRLYLALAIPLTYTTWPNVVLLGLVWWHVGTVLMRIYKSKPITVPGSVPFIIGINGYAHTGKDTIGLILTKHYGAKRIAFADALRTIASIINPLVHIDPVRQRKIYYNAAIKQFGYEYCKKQFPEFRPFLVKLGETLRNHIQPNVWLDIALPEFDDADDCKERLRVYTDARYANECARISARCGIVIRVNRPGVGPADETEAKNVAEVTPDVIIENNGTKEQLEKAVLLAADRDIETIIAKMRAHGAPIEPRVIVANTL